MKSRRIHQETARKQRKMQEREEKL